MNKATLPWAISAILLGVGATQSQAGGLWLNEYGDFSGGRSSAGAAAGLHDAASIIHNPAGGSLVEGSQLFASAGVMLVDVEFDLEYTNPISGSENGGEAGLDAPLASFAYVHDTGSEHWSFGVYTAGLAGAGLDYNKDWAGRFQTTDVELLLLAIAPTASYRINDQISVGMALQYFYGSLDLTVGLPNPGSTEPGKAELDGTDSSFAFTLGAIYELSERTRIGINYQSEIEADFDGKLKATVADANVDSNTELSMAQMVRVGLHHQVDDQLAVELSWGWDDWSTLDSVFVSLPEREAGLAKNWEDTYHYAIGFQLKVDENWDLTSGVSYDTNPVSAHERTADMPVDRQIRYSAGARYKLNQSMTIGGYMNYMDLGSAKIHGDFWGGEYKDNNVLGLTANFTWVL